jgi:ribosomal protein L21E
LNIDLNDYRNEESIVIALDTSGVKVTNRREWIGDIRDKYKKRGSWIKVVIGVDVKKKKVIAMKVSEEVGLTESKAAKKIIIKLYNKGIKIDEIIGD